MQWNDQRTIIRRFLRDPDTNIWTNVFLRRSYNDAQRDLQNQFSLLTRITALRVPPMYGSSYLYDWEWRHCPQAKQYQALRYYHQSDLTCCFRWEAVSRSFSSAEITDEGDQFTQPWEAWMVTTPGDLVRMWLPYDFYSCQFMWFDREPLGYATIKQISSVDSSWRTRSGDPRVYYRHDEMSYEIGLYPLPSAIWDQPDGSDEGVVAFVDDDTTSSEYGFIADRSGTLEVYGAAGVTTDVIEVDDNLMLVYEAVPVDVWSDWDESSFVGFLQKYLIYCVLEKAYSANTDGRIESLRAYWSYRKQIGFEMIKKWIWSRRKDRDYRLTTQDIPGRSPKTRHPRLPDEYPVVYP